MATENNSIQDYLTYRQPQGGYLQTGQPSNGPVNNPLNSGQPNRWMDYPNTDNSPQPMLYPGGSPTFNEKGPFATQDPAINNPSEPQQPQQPVQGADNSLYQGINPQLVTYFQQHGLTPTGRGTGPTDIAYLNDQMSAPGQDPGYWLNTKLPSIFAGGGGGGSASGGSGGGGAAQSAAPYEFGKGVPGMGTIFGAGGVTGSAPGNQLFDYLKGRGTGQITDASIPALQNLQNDPIIQGETAAYQATQDRGAKNIMAQNAEQAGPLANPNAQAASALENAAGNTANFEAQLMASELNNRRQEIQQALSGQQGLLTQEQQMQLQEELQQLGLVENAYQFNQSQQNQVALA